MDLSVVILCWNSKHYLGPCLQSLKNSTKAINKEIIIVDNGSGDGSAAFVKKEYPDIILIENKKNEGVAPARNQGMENASGKYILVLDVDTIVHDGAIGVLLKTMEKDKSIGLCGPKLVGVDGEIQYSCRGFPTILSKIYRQLSAKYQAVFLAKEELRDWAHDSQRDVGYVIGACQLIRREALDDVGSLDAKMFYGVEEVDFCLRLWEKGWRVVYNPESEITHIEQRVSRKKLVSRLQMEHIKSLFVYFYKHKYILTPPGYGNK